MVCGRVVRSNDRYVLPATTDRHFRVGIVLGAGINKQNKPFRELQARLEVASAAYYTGRVDKLIVSGDNRFKNYDEPTAMRNYLHDVKHIPLTDIQTDFAGRSTYESCERAAKVFGLRQTVIFSAPSHLPRAIYLCRHFGIETYGISSGVDARNAWRREPLANVKALYNIYVNGENTVLGRTISF